MSSADEGVRLTARVGATFRMLMKVRMLVAAVGLIFIPHDRLDAASLFVMACMFLLSLVALAGWEQFAPALARYPMLVALDVVISWAVLEVGGVLGPFFLFTVVTSVLAGLLFRWFGTVLICVLQALLYLVAVTELNVLPTFQTFIGMPFFYFVGGFIGDGLRRILDENDSLEDARREAEVAAAAAEERARLAREMHDSLAKTLRGISMSAATLPAWMAKSPSRAQEQAQEIVAAAEIASREARELLTDLRQDTVRLPFPEVLSEVVRAWGETSGVTASLAAEPGTDLPLRARHEALSIVREALENVARHAGAGHVEVGLARHAGRVVLTITDDGRGFSVSEDEFGELARAGHYGVIGMRERADRVGAALSVRSVPGEGTSVTLTLPDTRTLPEPRSGAAA